MVIVHRVNSYLNLYERNETIKSLIQLTLDAKTGASSDRPTLVPLKVKKKSLQTVSIAKKAFSPFIGKYNHPFFGEISVSMEKGKYYAKGQILGTFRIFPVGDNNFVIEDLPELPLKFIKSDAENPKGKSSTTQDDRGRPTAFIMYY